MASKMIIIFAKMLSSRLLVISQVESSQHMQKQDLLQRKSSAPLELLSHLVVKKESIKGDSISRYIYGWKMLGLLSNVCIPIATVE